MGKKRVEGWTEDATLGDASVENDGGGVGVADPDVLGSVCKRVLNPLMEMGSQTECLQFVDHFIWIDGVECQAVINEQHPDITWDFLGV